MSTHTSVPASAHFASVPPAEISGSSGWAYTASARAGLSSIAAMTTNVVVVPPCSVATRDPLERIDGPPQPGVVDVVVGDEADGLDVDGAGPYALGRQRVEQVRRQRTGTGADDVGLHRRGVDAAGEELREHVGQRAGAGVVVDQALDHRLQRDDAGRRDDA